MTSTQEVAPPQPRTRPPGRRAGYIATVVVDVIIFVFVNNILAWDLFPFITDEFDQVIPILNLSLSATIAVNGVWLWYDPVWFKSASQIALNVISIAAIVQMWRVFPFDFSSYSFDWGAVLRVVLVIGIVGTAIGIVVEAVRLIRRVVTV